MKYDYCIPMASSCGNQISGRREIRAVIKLFMISPGSKSITRFGRVDASWLGSAQHGLVGASPGPLLVGESGGLLAVEEKNRCGVDVDHFGDLTKGASCERCRD